MYYGYGPKIYNIAEIFFLWQSFNKNISIEQYIAVYPPEILSYNFPITYKTKIII